GSFMVEQVTLTPDRRFAIYNANTGPDPGDIDRRHLFKVPVTAATPTPLASQAREAGQASEAGQAREAGQASEASPSRMTSGTGIEWSPVVTADNRTVAFLRSDARRPPAPAVMPVSGGAVRAIGSNLL